MKYVLPDWYRAVRVKDTKRTKAWRAGPPVHANAYHNPIPKSRLRTPPQMQYLGFTCSNSPSTLDRQYWPKKLSVAPFPTDRRHWPDALHLNVFPIISRWVKDTGGRQTVVEKFQTVYETVHRETKGNCIFWIVWIFRIKKRKSEGVARISESAVPSITLFFFSF